MLKLSRSSLLLVVLPLLVVGLHLIWLTGKLNVQRKVSNDSAEQQNTTSFLRQNAASKESAVLFSQRFGVEAELQNTDDAATQQQAQTLLDLQPKVLAIDERSAQLTAYLTYTLDNKPVFISLVSGDTLLGYQVTAINMAEIKFDAIAADSQQQNTALKPSLTLRLFDSVAVQD